MNPAERLVARWRAEHSAAAIRETHLSWVLLGDEVAYKLKKPIDLGFADFSTLEKRREACQAELRLNRRQAPELYLDVVPLVGPEDNPQLEGPGEPLDWAVKMVRFPDDALLIEQAAHGGLTDARLDRLADDVAAFHAGLPPCPPHEPYGHARLIVDVALDNLKILGETEAASRISPRLQELTAWTQAEAARTFRELTDRRQAGWIRECHGDLHLGNMILRGDVIEVFDCIEFNPKFRWIDVASDLAFLVMDLVFRGHAPGAARLLNRYLEASGDYGCVPVLRFYLVYRAIVRALVAGIRADQNSAAETAGAAIDEMAAYIDLAERLAAARSPFLAATVGLSGSGKTTETQPLVEQEFAIRLRADVERKRLFGLAATDRPTDTLRDSLYSPEASQRVYEHLAQLAGPILEAGWPVIVDATFLKVWQRQRLAEVARQRGVPFVLLAFDCDADTLEQRLAARAQNNQDASDATAEVVAWQRQQYEPLGPEEQARAVRISADDAYETWVARLRAIRESAAP